MGFLTLFNIVALLMVHVNTQQTDDCLPLFLRYSNDHSYCKPPNPTCNILRTFVSPDDIALILKEHNTLRSKVASGKEQKLLPAANMLQLVWDDELAAVAQKHANQCKFDHDCPNCRRVQNFGVGQNLAIQSITNSPTLPDTDWPNAIKSWYDEVAYFSRNYIDPFVASVGEPTYGHFTQLVWADSWRIGCGYVLYQEPNEYKQLYVCNYGPAGNVRQKSMYKEGAPCSACPVNSCCDKSCGGTAEYSGLCRITDNRKPFYKPQENYIYYCDFQRQEDCPYYFTGEGSWLVYNTLSGSYLSTVLNGGEESTMVFNRKLKPSTPTFCFVINYRKGPDVAGQEEANSIKEIFTITDNNFQVQQELPTFGEDTRQQFSQYSMSLSWNVETEIKLVFSVPAGKQPQFFEIESVYATAGLCKQQ